MKATQEKISQVHDYIKKTISGECPVCKGIPKEWTVVVENFLFTTREADVSIPFIPIMCSICGTLQMISTQFIEMKIMNSQIEVPARKVTNG